MNDAQELLLIKAQQKELERREREVKGRLLKGAFKEEKGKGWTIARRNGSQSVAIKDPDAFAKWLVSSGRPELTEVRILPQADSLTTELLQELLELQADGLAPKTTNPSIAVTVDPAGIDTLLTGKALKEFWT